MSVADLSASAQNYLKVIWGLQEWSQDPVTVTRIAEKTGWRVSTVSGAVTKLADQGLVHRAPYGDVTLTDTGREHALMMVRRHRLMETFLVNVLGYGWDQVHDEAESLEHAVSDFMVERVDSILGHPTRDPHGDPIPSPHGDVHQPGAFSLSAASPGDAVVVERISDADPDLLRFFGDRGIVVGATLAVGAGSPYSDALHVRVPGSSDIPLGRHATDAVWVSPGGKTG